MIVKIEDSGRIVIPKEYRFEFNLRAGTEANVIPLPDRTGVAVMRLTPRCAVCGTEENLTKVETIALCPECRDKVKQGL